MFGPFDNKNEFQIQKIEILDKNMNKSLFNANILKDSYSNVSLLM